MGEGEGGMIWENGIETCIISYMNCFNVTSTTFPGGSDGKESACKAGDLGRFLGQEDLLEKGMASQSTMLALRIPWTEEPGGLQSMGSQRVRQD